MKEVAFSMEDGAMVRLYVLMRSINESSHKMIVDIISVIDGIA